MKKYIKGKWFIFATYILLMLAATLIAYIIFQHNSTFKNVVYSFFDVAENRTFDYRQVIKVMRGKQHPSNDIVVLAIDDASLEMLWDKYGEWPIPRSVYSDIINYLETQHPKSIVFDLLFIKSIRTSALADKALVNAMNSYDNIYTGMNFDAQTTEVRKAIDLPERLQVKLDNRSNVNLSKHTYLNCRAILSELINGNVNIGITSIVRNNDGIIRKIAPIMVYKNNYYPYLAFQVGDDVLKNQIQTKKYTINRKSQLEYNNGFIPLTKDGEAILNWYGPSKTHTVYPLYKVINDMKDNTKSFDFTNKIIIIGTTATSLQDTKSVPIQDAVYPGVEVHATFLNNMLDNNFIQKTNYICNITILFFVISIIGLIVMLSSSTIFALLSTTLFGIAYLFVSYYAMELYNLWIPVVLPVIAIIFSFAFSYLAKYIMKSKDFDYQYKLATIDGLTDLYNHRYFQETLKKEIDLSKRYGQQFSLLMTDIDFFKKFNDTYGHQAGDAVLKQVAKILKKNSRTTDFVCRYGGEEMAIILPNTTAEEAMKNAARIRVSIAENMFKLNSVDTANVTISMGVATFPEDAEDAQSLIEAADKGLYYAKEHGRNQVYRFSKGDIVEQ